jgi:hypothetical protein
MAGYAIYKKEKETLVGIFDTYKKAGEYLGLTGDAVQKAVKRKSVMKNEYIARKVEV